MNTKPKKLSDLDKLRLEIQRKFPTQEFDSTAFPSIFRHVSSKLARLAELGEIQRIPINLRSAQRRVNFKIIKLKEVIDPNEHKPTNKGNEDNSWSGLFVGTQPFQNQSRQKLGARHVIR